MVEPTSSLTAHVTPIAAGAYVTKAAFIGRTPMLALGDGRIVVADIGAEHTIGAHPDGAILTSVATDKSLVTGGDDGRVVRIAADGAMDEIAHEKGRWIDALAARDDGSVAWATGKDVRVRDAKGGVQRFAAISTVRGLAFAPKGFRVAAAHYNGASLWFPNASAPPETLEWKGSHLDAGFSPDGRFVVTSMQENTLHGWRLADGKNMRMSGYPSKTRSWSWSFDGNWLATSGADACIVWPFKDKDGPMGRTPRECCVRRAKVSQVAFHPKALVVAVGFEDGWLLLCRLTDAAEILVRGAGSETGGAVTALAWDANGMRVLFGTADGEAGVLNLPT